MYNFHLLDIMIYRRYEKNFEITGKNLNISQNFKKEN